MSKIELRDEDGNVLTFTVTSGGRQYLRVTCGGACLAASPGPQQLAEWCREVLKRLDGSSNDGEAMTSDERLLTLVGEVQDLGAKVESLEDSEFSINKRLDSHAAMVGRLLKEAGIMT